MLGSAQTETRDDNGLVLAQPDGDSEINLNRVKGQQQHDDDMSSDDILIYLDGSNQRQWLDANTDLIQTKDGMTMG